MVYSLFIFLFQADPLDTYVAPAKPTELAFDGYIGPLGKFLLALGGVLAIITAYRIYQNHMLGNGSIYQGTTNLMIGMICTAIIRLLFGLISTT